MPVSRHLRSWPVCAVLPDGADVCSSVWGGSHRHTLIVTRSTPQTWRSRLLDHLVGEGEKRGRQRQVKCLRCLGVDDDFELRWLLDGDIRWLRAIEDLDGLRGRTSAQFGFVCGN